jgi:predicted nucleotidyltransferase
MHWKPPRQGIKSDECKKINKTSQSGNKGSLLGNTYSKDSDYDLLLTFGHKLNWQEKNQIYDLIADIELKEKIIIDIKAYHERDLKDRWTPFREKVLKEGIFYGAI